MRLLTTMTLAGSRRHTYIKYLRVAFDTGLLAGDRLNVLVASFSAAKDSLPQWRGYSYGSSGVSLGFDLTELRPPQQSETLVRFARCIYSPQHKEELVRHALVPIQKVYTEYVAEARQKVKALQRAGTLPNEEGDRKETILKVLESMRLVERLSVPHSQVMKDFVSLTALFKDESFAEEDEWRLVLPIQGQRSDLRNPPIHRPRGDSLVPTIAYPLQSEKDFPLREVVIGPGAHANADAAMDSFLHGEKLQVRSRHSKVPYRPTWK